MVDREGTVVWPEAPVLPGTTMLLLQALDAPKQITAPVRVSDVPNMAAAFATNVSIGVRSISALDDVSCRRTTPYSPHCAAPTPRSPANAWRRAPSLPPRYRHSIEVAHATRDQMDWTGGKSTA
ncbi:hypothetical protein ACFWUW_05435 [Streptomyces sp. NPDC058655]|uniref:hypothetical protein n=1 Tax=unclassified Streptomyces TaxID=2593676 RepID=UPI00364F00B3